MIPSEAVQINGTTLLRHDLFANGIVYVDLAFDVSDIPEDMQLYLPLFGKMRLGMGAAGLDYIETAKRKSLRAGGIGFALASGLDAAGQGDWQKIVLRLRALERNIPEALSLLGDLICEGDNSDDMRIGELIFEARNKLQASVIPSGHTFARRTAASSLSVAAYRDEQWNGRTQLVFQGRLCEGLSDLRTDFKEIISGLSEKVFRRGRLLMNLTGEKKALDILLKEAEKLLGRIKAGGDVNIPGRPKLPRSCEGIAIPAQVCYVAKVYPAPPYDDPVSPYLMLLSRVLASGILYNRIRVQGGAYGGMSLYDPLGGHFAFLSYRDPHLLQTLKVYREALEAITEGRFSDEEIESALIGTIGSLDRPMDPPAKGYMSHDPQICRHQQ